MSRRVLFNVMKLTFPFNPVRNLGRSLTLVIIDKMQITFVEVNLTPYCGQRMLKYSLRTNTEPKIAKLVTKCSKGESNFAYHSCA